MSDDESLTNGGAEGDRRDAETNRIAAEGNRISAEGERVTAGEARILEDSDRAHRRRRLTAAQLGAYAMVIAVAIFGFYRIEAQQTEIDDQQIDINNLLAQLAVSQSCTETFLVRTVQVADQRTNVASEVQKADKAQNIAWADYVAMELEAADRGSDVTEADAIEAVRNYFNKLQTYLDAVTDAENQRVQQPYPDTEAYRQCLATPAPK